MIKDWKTKELIESCLQNIIFWGIGRADTWKYPNEPETFFKMIFFIVTVVKKLNALIK